MLGAAYPVSTILDPEFDGCRGVRQLGHLAYSSTSVAFQKERYGHALQRHHFHTCMSLLGSSTVTLFLFLSRAHNTRFAAEYCVYCVFEV